MTPEDQLDLNDMNALAAASARITQACDCGIDACREWTRVPATFPQAQMRTVGTLAGDPYAEPSYAEYHPHGSHYWSPEAPVALRHFPYNRCAIQQCSLCQRCCLTYVEAGGYYVEPRMRALAGQVVVDVAAPD